MCTQRNFNRSSKSKITKVPNVNLQNNKNGKQIVKSNAKTHPVFF